MRYKYRCVGPDRVEIFEFLAAHPNSTKSQIVAGLGMDKDKVRVTLHRMRTEGDIEADTSRRDYKYKVVPETQRLERGGEKALELAAIAKAETAKRLQAVAKQRAPVVRERKKAVRVRVRAATGPKQTKVWQPPVQKVVTVTMPENVKVTIGPSFKYEKLDLSRHLS